MKILYPTWFHWKLSCMVLAGLFGVIASAEETGKAPASFIGNHLRFAQFDVANGFRYIDKMEGLVTERDLQWKATIRPQVILREGWSTISGRLESGTSFSGSWSYTGIGLRKRSPNFNLKSLFLTQKLSKHLEAEIGGIEFSNGAASEATYADVDGWLIGYRVTGSNLRGVDTVTFTVGYVGDLYQPNVFARFHRLSEPNYAQLLLVKKVGNHQFSFDMNSLRRTGYIRPAAKIRIPSLRIAEELGLESIVRTNDGSKFGWALRTNQKFGNKQWSGGFNYSDIPSQTFVKDGQTMLQNGDVYNVGKRLGGTLRYCPTPALELSVFGSRRVESSLSGPRWRGQVAVRYQLSGWVNKLMR